MMMIMIIVVVSTVIMDRGKVMNFTFICMQLINHTKSGPDISSDLVISTDNYIFHVILKIALQPINITNHLPRIVYIKDMCIKRNKNQANE